MWKLIFNAQSTPVAPVWENKHTMFVDNADGKLKMEDSNWCICTYLNQLSNCVWSWLPTTTPDYEWQIYLNTAPSHDIFISNNWSWLPVTENKYVCVIAMWWWGWWWGAWYPAAWWWWAAWDVVECYVPLYNTSYSIVVWEWWAWWAWCCSSCCSWNCCSCWANWNNGWKSCFWNVVIACWWKWGWAWRNTTSYSASGYCWWCWWGNTKYSWRWYKICCYMGWWWAWSWWNYWYWTTWCTAESSWWCWYCNEIVWQLWWWGAWWVINCSSDNIGRWWICWWWDAKSNSMRYEWQEWSTMCIEGTWYWAWWWGWFFCNANSYACWARWWNWYHWVVFVYYPCNFSLNITWWTISYCCWMKVHTFDTNWTLCIN